MMIKLLGKIPAVHNAILKYAFSNQQKPKDEQFARMEFKFVDSNGKRYYRYIDDFELPVVRMEQLQIKMKQIDARINADDLGQWIEAAEKILMKKDKEKATVEAVQMLGALKERRKLIYDNDLFMRTVCIIYIREDQDPCVWDEELEEAKYQQLKSDKAGGLYDFFYSAGLKAYLPSLGDMQKDWQSFSDNQQAQMDAFVDMVSQVNGTSHTSSINT